MLLYIIIEAVLATLPVSLVLLTSNTQSFYDKQFILKLYGFPYLEKGGKEKINKKVKNVYENNTSITRINEKMNK